MIPYSCDIVFSSLVGFSNSIIGCILSSNLCIACLLFVVLMAVLLFRREADEETEHRDGGFFETTTFHTHENYVQLSSPPPPPEMSHAKETSDDKKPAAPTKNLASRISSGNLYRAAGIVISDVLDDDYSCISRPNGAERIITSNDKSSSSTEAQASGEIEKTPSYSPPKVASRITSSGIIVISDVLDDDYSRIRPNGAEEKIITSSDKSSFSTEAQEKTPSYSPPKVASRIISPSTLYPAGGSDNDIIDHDSAISSRPTGAVESVVTLPVGRFSGEAGYVSKACEIEKKPYTPAGVEPRNKSTLYPSFSDIHGSANITKPNGMEQMIITSEKSAPVRRFSSEAHAQQIEKKPFLASRSSTYLSQGSSSGGEIHDDSADHTTIRPNSRNQIVTTSEKTFVSSPVRGFSSEAAHVSKAREIKKKPYSHGSSMDPKESTKSKKATRNPPSKVGKETIITNPPSKKGKEIITENLSDATENDEGGSLDAAWDAIKRGDNKKARKKKLKKSETWEIPQQRRREVQRLDSEEVLPSSPLWKELRKSVTFDDVISAKLRGGLMRRDDSWNPDEFKKQMDGFIKAKKDEIRDGIEESKRRKFLNLFRRGQ